MLGICLKNVVNASKTFTLAVARIENRVFHTLFRSQDENASLNKTPSACSGSGQSTTCQCRDLHITAVAPGKYHNLIRRRAKVKKKMAFLSSRLERLDPEDRPTGCILCPMRGDIEIDYKNVRLLSQFVSPHTGRIYGKALTGLCRKKQNEIAKAIRRARTLGYMPVTMKYFEFHNDPAIF